MSDNKNLKPHVHTIRLIGGTGNGKTEIAAASAAPQVREILRRAVGETNTTLRERLFVYTSEYKDRIVVAVKPEEEPISYELFKEKFTRALAQVANMYGTVQKPQMDAEREIFEEALREEIETRNNAKAFFSFLAEEEKNDFIRQMKEIYGECRLHEKNGEIYCAVKERLNQTVKQNRFLTELQREIEHFLDNVPEDIKRKLTIIWYCVNSQLKQVFFEYFSKEDISEDGYYFKEISLDSPDEKFINAMFTANDMQQGERLSLEVLCGEIIIYVPMDSSICDMISENPLISGFFSDPKGNHVFGMLDTRGFYHVDDTEDDNADYGSDLIYGDNTDALVMVVPLTGDTNAKKLQELYSNILKKYNRQIPVFLLRNKLDLLVEKLEKEKFSADPLSMETIEDTKLTLEEIKEEIFRRENALNDILQNSQNEERKALGIKTLSCYLKRSSAMPEELVKEYNIKYALKAIMCDVAEHFWKNVNRIPFRVEASGIISPEVDKEMLVKLMHQSIENEGGTALSKGLSNIGKNKGLTPHGNSYNALRRRLKNGQNYIADIKDYYFVNCDSFEVEFPEQLKTFIDSGFLKSAIGQTLSIKGGEFIECDGRDKLNKYIELRADKRKLASVLLYDNALQMAERDAFSFGGKFQRFLQNSEPYFDVKGLDEELYVKTLEEMIVDATRCAISMYVIFK